jgi:hypothetical protein
MTDANEFLMRGGTPAIKFPNVGSTMVGIITRPPKLGDVTDPVTKEVKRWPSGDPQKQIIIELQTELRESDDDGGERTLWAKGLMMNAIRDAVRASGARGLQVGGVLQVTYYAEKPSDSAVKQPTKLYRATYWPPEQAPVEVPGAPWEQQASTPPPPPPRPSAPPQQAYAQPQGRVAARQVSAPPAVVPGTTGQVVGEQMSFLERLRQTSANQQAYREGANHHGQVQDEEPPF